MLTPNDHPYRCQIPNSGDYEVIQSGAVVIKSPHWDYASCFNDQRNHIIKSPSEDAWTIWCDLKKSSNPNAGMLYLLVLPASIVKSPTEDKFMAAKHLLPTVLPNPLFWGYNKDVKLKIIRSHYHRNAA
jgi:hypothetical protein